MNYTSFSNLVDNLLGLVSAVVPVLIGFGLILFLLGAVRYLYTDPGKKEHKELLGWGLLALFVMVSIWGIVGLLRKTFLP